MSQSEISYVPLTTEHRDEVAKFLADHYLPRANVVIGAGGTKATLRSGYYGDHINSALSSGLSVAARLGGEEGTLVGLCTGIVLRSHQQQQQQHQSNDPPKAENCLRELQRVDDVAAALVDVWSGGVTNVVLVDILVVHPDYGRRGIGYHLTKLILEGAKREGCQAARSESSTPYSKSILSKLGFNIAATLDIKQLDPPLPYVDQMNHTNFYIMTKSL